jgi:hypothetical protein
MDRKRPHSSSGPSHPRQSPQKKQNTFKSPQQTPQKSPSVTQSKLPPGTPTVTTRYGISTTDASTLVDRIDTFATLVKCVAHVVDNCGGSYEEDRNLGSYLIDAVNAVTVCRPPSAPLRVLVLIIRERQRVAHYPHSKIRIMSRCKRLESSLMPVTLNTMPQSSPRSGTKNSNQCYPCF